ncbi:MAG: protease pro-enzyme activation domain-containing protein [Solirubrobacteraceae bacterium]
MHSTRIVGSLPASQRLRLTIALQPQSPAGLQSFATAVSTPGSPEYHNYLTVRQFAQRFGAKPEAIAAVEKALRAEGLRVGAPTANELTIPVTGTTAQVERTFSVTESRAFLGRRSVYFNEHAPVLPASVAGYVQGVVGLDDLAVPQPAGLEYQAAHATPAERRFHARLSHSAPHVLTGGPQPCAAATSEGASSQSGVGYTADELAAAYQFSGLYQAGDQGAGQTVGVIEFGGFNTSDVGQYTGCFSIAPTINQVNVDGGPGPFNPATDSDGESALDIETVAGLAPKATIDVYQAPDTAVSQVDMLNAAASQNVAKVISDSNGLCEAVTANSIVQAEGSALAEMAAQGQSFFDSSGDSGSEQCSQVGASHSGWSAALAVLDPASQPDATGVGGTTLFKTVNGQPAPDTDGSLPTESVWNDGTNTECQCGGEQAPGSNGGGGGGGLSKNFAMPSYQSGAASSLGVFGPDSGGTSFCGQPMCREVPDVSADASALTGYVTFSDGQWGISGGTSAAAPLWASFAALTNADPACRGLPLGFANPALYQIAGSAYAANFHDISSQVSPFSGVTNNDTLDQWDATGANNENPTNLYPTTVGYDMATGLGSMIAPTLAASLCGLTAPVYTVTVTSPGPQLSITGVPVSLQVAGSDSGGAGAPLTYAATGLPAGLSMSSSGLISGSPTTDGSSTVTVTAGDRYTNGGSTQFTWSVVTPQPPSTSTPTTGGLKVAKPELSITLSAGAFSPPLQSIRISLPAGLSFSSKVKKLKKGIVVKSGGTRIKYTIKAHGRTATLVLQTPITGATLTVGSPAIIVSTSEQKKIRKHKIKRLIVNIAATNTSGATTPLTIEWKA